MPDISQLAIGDRAMSFICYTNTHTHKHTPPVHMCEQRHHMGISMRAALYSTCDNGVRTAVATIVAEGTRRQPLEGTVRHDNGYMLRL